MKGIIKNTKNDESYFDSSEWAFMQQSVLGTPAGIADFKNKLQVSKINDNKVRMSSGVFFLGGRAIIEENYTDYAVDSGSLGLSRYDYVIAEFIRDGEGESIDTLHFRVLKGTSSSTNPSTPTLINNDTIKQEMIAVLYITGTTLNVWEMNTSIIPNLINVVPTWLDKVEKVDIVYSGSLRFGESVNIPLSKYKRLCITLKSQNSRSCVFYLDLTTPLAGSEPLLTGWTYLTHHVYSGTDGQALGRLWRSTVAVNTSKTKVSYINNAYKEKGGDWQGYPPTANDVITLIEGVY